MANIVPSILTDDIIEAQRQLDRLADVAGWVQIDVMDGEFVDEMSFPGGQLAALQTEIQLEAHLMVADPAAWLGYLDPKIFKRVYFHIEAVPDPEELIKKIRDKNLFVGIANNIETSIDSFADYVEMIDNVLFMSVNPGKQGQTFHRAVLEKVREFGNQFPEHQTAIDGGVTVTLIPDIVKAGIDDIGVGSVIAQASDPKKTIQQLEEQLT